MEEFDREMASKVWRRVQSREPPAAAEDPRMEDLILLSHGLTGLYLGLRRMLPGKTGERCAGLYRSAKQTLCCLQGIRRLEGEVLSLPPPDTGTGSASRRLCICVQREQRLGTALEHLAGSGDFSMVYARLCRMSAERCAAALELLGACDLPPD